jgi:hypothetical protein
MSTLKVNKIRDNSGSTDAIVLDPSGGAVLAGVTTISTARVTTGITSTSLQVGAAVTITESGIEASGIGITCANINGGAIGGRRNMIINGAMLVAQRGTAATTEQLYQTVDRMRLARNGCDENPSQNQQSLGAGSAVYALGFTKSFRIVNGNQTSGAGSGDSVGMSYRIEARDIRSSGWDYTNPNSFITLSFWIYASVGQTYYMRLRSMDGTSQQYVMSYTVSANTWTKVIKTIPGNSNIQFDDDVNQGLQINWNMFAGTNYTDSGVSLNAWGAYDANAQFPDFTSTWFTTNDATWNITGLQLELGTQATPFEHRSFGEELQLCKRYYQKSYAYGTAPGTSSSILGCIYSRYSDEVTNRMDLGTRFEVEMRTIPTVTAYSPSTGTANRVDDNSNGVGDTAAAVNTVSSLPKISARGIGGVVSSTAFDNVGSYHFTAEAEI